MFGRKFYQKVKLSTDVNVDQALSCLHNKLNKGHLGSETKSHA